MKKRTIAAVVAGIAWLAAGVARAGDAPAAKHPYASFKPGSTVTLRSTTRMGGDAGDQPAQEQRMTLVSASEKEYVLKTEILLAGDWHGQDQTVPIEAGEDGAKGTPEALGEEKLTLDGQEYVCKKAKTVSRGTTTTTWTYGDSDVLKSESTGPRGAQSSLVVTSLRKKQMVAGKELVCREAKYTAKTESSETTVTSLTNDGVLGHVVRSDTTVRTSGMMMSTASVVTAFETK
jgi:hypothetical protein